MPTPAVAAAVVAVVAVAAANPVAADFIRHALSTRGNNRHPHVCLR